MKVSKRKRKRDSWGEKLLSAKLVKESFANALCGSPYTYLLLRKIICVRVSEEGMQHPPAVDLSLAAGQVSCWCLIIFQPCRA